MKVKELIKELQKHDPELDVVIDPDRWIDVSVVKKDDNNGTQKLVVVLD